MHKILDLEYPLCIGNEMVYFEDRNLLPLKWFMTFFRCTRMMKALFNNIYKLLSCLNRAISEDIDYQIAYKILDLGYSLRTGNRMLCYNESHSLLLKWLITFLRCIKKVGGFLFNIYKPLIVHAVPSTALVGSQIAHKMSDLGYPIIMGNGMLGYKV